MATWIALFRGINVGGHHILPMKELVAELEDLGLASVRTYIQSGNVVFESASRSAAALSKKIADRVDENHGFRPAVLVMRAADLARAMDRNPFPEGEPEPKTLHLSFLVSKPSEPDLDALEAARSPTERFVLIDSVFYLHAPDGIGSSRLATVVEKALGVSATARNWRTVRKLRELATSS